MTIIGLTTCWGNSLTEQGRQCFAEVKPDDDLGLCADHVDYFRDPTTCRSEKEENKWRDPTPT